MLSKKGFTLVEMMVVVVIIGILGAVIIGGVGGSDPEYHKSVKIDNLSEYYDSDDGWTTYTVATPIGEFATTVTIYKYLIVGSKYDITVKRFLGSSITEAVKVE